jgi:hypothetical protein
MKKTLGMIIGTVIGAVFAVVCTNFVQDTFFSKEVKLEKALMQSANEINKNCPFMVDKDTRLDNTFGGPGKKIQYYYTLVNYTKDGIDIEEFEKAITPILITNAKNNTEMESLFKNGTTAIYHYKDKDGLLLSSVEIKPEDLGYNH